MPSPFTAVAGPRRDHDRSSQPRLALQDASSGRRATSASDLYAALGDTTGEGPCNDLYAALKKARPVIKLGGPFSWVVKRLQRATAWVLSAWRLMRAFKIGRAHV